MSKCFSYDACCCIYFSLIGRHCVYVCVCVGVWVSVKCITSHQVQPFDGKEYSFDFSSSVFFSLPIFFFVHCVLLRSIIFCHKGSSVCLNFFSIRFVICLSYCLFLFSYSNRLHFSWNWNVSLYRSRFFGLVCVFFCLFLFNNFFYFIFVNVKFSCFCCRFQTHVLRLSVRLNSRSIFSPNERTSAAAAKKYNQQQCTAHTTHCVRFFLRLLSFMLLFSPRLAFVSYTVEFLWIFTQNVSMSSKPDCMYVLKRKTKTNSLLVQHLVPVIVCVAVFSTLSVLDSCVLLLFAFAVSVASIFDSILSDFFSVRVQE